jgi:hypothetical protein
MTQKNIDEFLESVLQGDAKISCKEKSSAPLKCHASSALLEREIGYKRPQAARLVIENLCTYSQVWLFKTAVSRNPYEVTYHLSTQ